MSDNGGWIKLHRSIKSWEWYTDGSTARLFIHLLLSANHKETRWRGHTVGIGEVLTGRHQLAAELGLSEQVIRTSLNRLKSTSEITIKTTNKFSIITINNYDAYQAGDSAEQPATQPATQPTTNQQLTSNQPATNHIQEGEEGKEEEESSKRERAEKSGVRGEPVEKLSRKCDIPPLSNPGFSDRFMVEVWPYYLKTRNGKPYKNRESQEVALRSLHRMSCGDEQEAIAALQDAVANGWQGFKWYFEHKKRNGGSNGAARTTADIKGITPEGIARVRANIPNIPGIRRTDG